jgi:hypothetical protein
MDDLTSKIGKMNDLNEEEEKTQTEIKLTKFRSSQSIETKPPGASSSPYKIKSNKSQTKIDVTLKRGEDIEKKTMNA